MSSFDPATVRQADAEFTPRRPEKFQDLMPAKEYQAAWLKCSQPAEFTADALTKGKGFNHPLVYVLERHRLGLRLLPPSVNEPGPAFVPKGEGKSRSIFPRSR